MAPARSRASTLACVLADAYMSASMAGAMTNGARDASMVAVSASSVIPSASLAREFAVAGATRTQSAFIPSSTWSIEVAPWSQREVETRWCVSPANVVAPMKRVAASVITTFTVAPSCVRLEAM